MAPIKTGTIAANGNTIEFLEKGSGPLLLCLHGFPDHAWSFEAQLHFFAQQGYRVVAPFMRGYGPPLLEENPSFTAFETGSDAIALIDALGENSAVLLGHDWGASAAYSAAFQAPDKISRLVTAAVPYGRQLSAAFVANAEQQRRSWYMFFFLAPFAEAAVAYNDFAFIDRLWADWSPGWKPDPDYMSGLKQTLSKPGALENALAYYRHSFSGRRSPHDASGFAARFGKDPIRVPTLYLHGAQDGCIGADMQDGMNALFPAGLQTVNIRTAGHFLHLEEQDLFNQSVANFLNNSDM